MVTLGTNNKEMPMDHFFCNLQGPVKASRTLCPIIKSFIEMKGQNAT